MGSQNVPFNRPRMIVQNLENDIKHQCISLRPAQQSSYQEGRTRIPLTSLPNHISVPVLGQYLDVQRHMLWSLFVFSKLW